MKKINTTDITGLQGAPFLKATHDQYTETIQETTGAIVKGLLGTYTTGDLIILHGCVVAVTSGAIPGTGTATLSAGAIYYNGEIYQVDANGSLSTTNPQTLIWEVVTTYRSGDPVEWSDGATRDMHQQDKLRLVAGTAGTGLANYNASTVKKYKNIWTNLTLINGWTSIAGQTAMYKIDELGNVMLRGQIRSDAASAITFANMPTGLQPTQDTQLFSTINTLSGGLSGTPCVAVAPSAGTYFTVQGITTGTTIGNIYLYGVHYNIH